MNDNQEQTQHAATCIVNQFNFEAGSNPTIISGNTFNAPATFMAGNLQAESMPNPDIKQLLDDLSAYVDEVTGLPVFTDTMQWYAVYRVLSEHCNYPKNLSVFCRMMAEQLLTAGCPPCKYNTIRCVPNRLEKLAVSTNLWQHYAKTSDAYAKQCAVADFLLRRIRNL